MFMRFSCGAPHGEEPDWAILRLDLRGIVRLIAWHKACEAFWAQACPVHGAHCPR